MDDDAKRGLIEAYIAAYNAIDIDGMLAVIHPEIEFKNISGGEVTLRASGADEFRRLAEQAAALFQSRHQTVTRFSPEGDRFIIDVDYEAVLATDLPDGVKAGESIRLAGQSEFSFRDALIDGITDIS